MTSIANIQTVVDIGFVVLVIFICIKTLLSESGEGDSTYKKWKQDLKELSDSLRLLIDEASIASNQFDRNLLRRRDELEILLHRLQQTEGMITKNAFEEPQRVMQKGEPKEKATKQDLPNSSWYEPFSKTKTFDSPKDFNGKKKGNFELEHLVEEQRDSLDLSTTREQRSRSSQREESLELQQYSGESFQDDISQGQALREQVRLVKESQGAGERRGEFRRPLLGHNQDPVAYKIARRLLLQGQEIHVVARKLELPLSEVRILDKLVREELARNPDGHNYQMAREETDPGVTETTQKELQQRNRIGEIEREYVLF